MTPLGERARTVSSVRDFGRAAGAGEADDFREFGIPDHGEAIAADAGAGGFEEAEAGVGGDGGVDRGAAVFENLDGGERGERMRGACGAGAAHRGGAAGEAGAGGAIAGVDVGAEESVFAFGLEFWEGLVRPGRRFSFARSSLDLESMPRLTCRCRW